MQRRTLLLATLATPALAQTPQQGESLAPGWRMDTLMRWGDGVVSDAAPWNPAAPEADAASTQFGWDGRVVAAMGWDQAADRLPRAVLVVAHPMVDAAMAFPDGRDRAEVAAAMQGASIVNVTDRGRGWVVAAGGFQSRRLHGATLCRAAGPGAEAMGGAIRGVFGIDGGADWGSSRVLLTEGQASDWAPRLPGRVGPGHGWVVECDAADPNAIPVKRSALGRGATDAAATLGDGGRLVVFLAHAAGLARFVSAGPASAPDALDSGTLSAARQSPGAVEWVALPANAWQDMAAALAAAGATPLPAAPALAFGPGWLLLTAPEAGSMVLRPVEDVTGTRYTTAVLAGPRSPQGQVAAAADARGQGWFGTEPQPGRAAAVSGGGRVVLTAPRGAAIGGLALSPDRRALFTVIRTPGREPGRSFARPATRWPDFTPGVPPRSALVALSGGL